MKNYIIAGSQVVADFDAGSFEGMKGQAIFDAGAIANFDRFCLARVIELHSHEPATGGFYDRP